MLPFQSLDEDAASTPIAQGLFDELVTTLGQVPQLRVAGRGSSLNLARSERPLHEVARALRVAYLVQGSVQRQGEEVRVHVCLVDGSSGFERWSHSYRGSTGNVFALQDDIARAVSANSAARWHWTSGYRDIAARLRAKPLTNSTCRAVP